MLLDFDQGMELTQALQSEEQRREDIKRRKAAEKEEEVRKRKERRELAHVSTHFFSFRLNH
jgi:hypothetical protein